MLRPAQTTAFPPEGDTFISLMGFEPTDL